MEKSESSGHRLRDPACSAYFRCWRFRCDMSQEACEVAMQGALEAAQCLVEGLPVGAVPRWQLNRLQVCGRCGRIRVRHADTAGGSLIDRAFEVVKVYYAEAVRELQELDWYWGDASWDRRRESDKQYREAHREARAAYNREWRKRRKA